MSEIALQITILLLAAIFTGIVLFLATVLRRTFESITEAEYYAVFTQVIHQGRKSMLINSIVLIPLLALVVYLWLYRLEDVLFISGVVIYIIGSFVLSRWLNEPNYAKLLALRPTDSEAIGQLRTRLNRGNIARALISATGVVLMALSFVI